MVCLLRRPLASYPQGFPVLLDNMLSKARSSVVMQYLQDANFLDSHTKALSAELLTYSSDLQALGYVRCVFAWQVRCNQLAGLPLAPLHTCTPWQPQM
jgi:hypothetical protein